MNAFALEAEGISKFFPGVKALDDVSFDLEKGEVHILVGENGAGKSTILKTIVRQLRLLGGVGGLLGGEATLLQLRQLQREGILGRL